MAVTDLRFTDKNQVKRMIIACEFTDTVIERDEHGFYLASYTAPDWFKEMPEVVVAPPSEPRPDRPVRVASEGGACALVRAWTRDNPTATREDALAMFPELNRTTVAIQFKKARG